MTRWIPAMLCAGCLLAQEGSAPAPDKKAPSQAATPAQAPKKAEARPLTPAEQNLFDAGKKQYMTVCGACHQPNGQGLEGLAPPLVDSPWANGSPERLVRIALQGIRGPIDIKGKVWNLEMPALGVLPDQDIAALLTYIRREWGHTASAIAPETVAKIRKETEERFEPWTEEELLKIK